MGRDDRSLPRPGRRRRGFSSSAERSLSPAGQTFWRAHEREHGRCGSPAARQQQIRRVAPIADRRRQRGKRTTHGDHRVDPDRAVRRDRGDDPPDPPADLRPPVRRPSAARPRRPEDGLDRLPVRPLLHARSRVPEQGSAGAGLATIGAGHRADDGRSVRLGDRAAVRRSGRPRLAPADP